MAKFVGEKIAASSPTDFASIRRAFEMPAAIAGTVRRQSIHVGGSFRGPMSSLRAFDSAAPAPRNIPRNAATRFPTALDLPERPSVRNLKSRLWAYEAPRAANPTTTATRRNETKLFEHWPSVKTRSMAFRTASEIAAAAAVSNRRRSRYERPATNMTTVANFDAAAQYVRAVVAANASPKSRPIVATSNRQQVPNERSVKRMIERFGN